MTCPEDILPWMYPGVFASSIDASKFFHMFLTVDEERKFMGLIYPDTSYHYGYSRLPMGSSSSPAWTDSRKVHIRFENDLGSSGVRGPYLSPD
jgi:hypothetical protein